MITVTLTPELEDAIQDRAQQQGTEPELLVLDSLRGLFLIPEPPDPAVEGGTMADFLKDFIGCIDSREKFPEGSRVSEYNGHKLGELLREKHRAGKL